MLTFKKIQKLKQLKIFTILQKQKDIGRYKMNETMPSTVHLSANILEMGTQHCPKYM